jgi:hypothetical protein
MNWQISVVAVTALSITAGDAYSVRAKTQNAVDAAVLAGAGAPGGTTDAERIEIAQSVYTSNKSKSDTAHSDGTASATFTVSDDIVYGNVTFEMTPPCGSSVVHLSAPLDGAMAGLVLATGRTEPTATSTIRGAVELFLEGSVYLPTHNLEFHGGPAASMPRDSMVLIARTIRFAGSSAIELGSQSGTPSMPDHSAEMHIPGNVRLMR